MNKSDTESNGIEPSALATSFGPFRLLKSQRLLLQGSKPIPISSRAMDILLALVEQPGRVLSHDDLMTRAWPDTRVDDVNLRVHMSALRRVLGDGADGAPYLVTIPGRGYLFVGSVGSEPGAAVPAIVPRARATTLPQPLVRVIGRSKTIARICAQLPQRRFVTIVGPGGIGKTTVATAVAGEIGASYPDGVKWVDLATLDRDESVPAAIAFALGLANFATDPAPGLMAHLQDKSMLLVLDCCDRVVTGAARIVERILRSAPGLHVLTTSRETLRASGEYVVRLPPLATPRAPASLTLAEAKEYSALQLFADRAASIVDGFELNDANVALVARICARLDGIALAIELAAGHLLAFQLSNLASLLDDKFRLMAAGRRTALPRHQTIQATLEWSYETLPEQQRLVLRRLAVFDGAANLAAIRAIVADAASEQEAVIASLVRLVDKSLVAAEPNESGASYRLLDTTRAYAIEKLSVSGELENVSRRHAEYYQRHLHDTAADWDSGPTEYTADLAADIANIRAALDWAASPQGDRSIGLRLTIEAIPLWMQLSLLGECRARVNQALAISERATAADESRQEMILRAALGMSLLYTQGPVGESEEVWTRVLELAESADNPEYQLRALYGLWLYKVLVSEHRAALTLAQRFHQLAERASASADLATSERMTAMALHYLGDQPGTRACLERGLDAPLPSNRRFHSTHYGLDQRVGTYALLARSLWLLGLPEQAIQAAQFGVDEAIKVGHANSLCVALADGASLVAILVDDVEQAERFAGMLTEHAEKHALGVWRTYGLALRGRYLMRRGETAEGVTLLRSALNELRDTPFDIRFELYLVWLAETLAAAGQSTEALAAIDEALHRAERTEERWNRPELLRIRGELLLRSGAADAAGECFAQSLRDAQEQHALSWELRTAMSLARWQPDRAPLLKSVFDRFSEGFATTDLIAAKQLLDELGC